MNKSKFLKKSLAMLLAVMLVVAMIPMSASAAGEPTFSHFYVDNVEATINGDTITATAKGTTVNLSAVSEDTDASFAYQDKNGSWETVLTNVSLGDKATATSDGYTLKVKAYKGPNDAEMATVYTLNIAIKGEAKDSDATLKAVVNDGANGLKDMTSYEIDGSDITIYIAFGKVIPSSLVEKNFTTNSSKATVSAPVISDGKGTVTVTAEDTSTKTYNIVIKNESAFTAFTVPNQIGESVITAEGKDANKNTVEINVPFGTDYDEKIVPTFSVNDGITKVTTDEAGKNVVESGVTEIKFTDKAAVNFYIWKGTVKQDVPVAVTLTAVEKNPEAKATEITVGDSNATEITDKSVTVELSAGYDFSADAAKTVKVVVKASKGATVSVPAQGLTANGTNGTFTFDTINIQGKTFVIRVVSQDTKTTTSYTVNLTAASAAKAEMTDFTLKGKLPGATKDIAYSATWSGKTGTVTLPYALKAANALDDFTVYATASTGADVYISAADAGNENDAIEFGAAYNTYSGKVPTAADAIEYYVRGSDGTVSTYKVVLKFEAAKTERKISGAELVGTDTIGSITESNTYKASVGTAKDAAGNTVNTLKVSLPNSFKADTIDTYLNALNISDGAVAYLSGASTVGTKIVALDPDEAGAQNGSATPFKFDGKLDAVNDKGVIDTSKAIVVYVLSETNAVTLAGTEKVSEEPFKSASTVYYVYGVKAAAEKGNAITKMSSTVDTNVTAAISGKTITVTVPNSYEKTNTFSLDFALSKLATLTTANDGSGKEIKPDLGSVDTADRSFLYVDSGELYLDDTSPVKLTTGKTGSIYVKAENGDYNKYTLNLKVAEAEKGAEITALKGGKIAASISGKTITLVLPYNTKLNPVKLDITASKMATVEVGAADYDADKNYDLNSDVTIKVTSEDKKTTNVYTLKTSTAAQFSDVKSTDWFYADVMAAAKAGIVNGRPDGTFAPKESVKRRDFAIMLANMLGADLSSYTTSPFKDVADDDYALSAIAYLKAEGIIGGYSDGTFKPAQTITREEASKMIAVALDLKGTTTEKFKDDAKIANWAKTYAYACKAAGIFEGDEKGNFNPKKAITRAETAKVMVSALDVK